MRHQQKPVVPTRPPHICHYRYPEHNVPIETVSKMLGHSTIDMTRVYARLLDKKVVQDMIHLEGKWDFGG